MYLQGMKQVYPRVEKVSASSFSSRGLFFSSIWTVRPRYAWKRKVLSQKRQSALELSHLSYTSFQPYRTFLMSNNTNLKSFCIFQFMQLLLNKTKCVFLWHSVSFSARGLTCLLLAASAGSSSASFTYSSCAQHCAALSCCLYVCEGPKNISSTTTATRWRSAYDNDAPHGFLTTHTAVPPIQKLHYRDTESRKTLQHSTKNVQGQPNSQCAGNQQTKTTQVSQKLDRHPVLLLLWRCKILGKLQQSWN